MRRYGGFEHNRQSAACGHELEERYAEFRGLNLTFECREGILKHCSVRNARALGDLGERFIRRQQPSLEAQLANLADEIAYNITMSTTHPCGLHRFSRSERRCAYFDANTMS